jgi:hypothetical protein
MNSTTAGYALLLECTFEAQAPDLLGKVHFQAEVEPHLFEVRPAGTSSLQVALTWGAQSWEQPGNILWIVSEAERAVRDLLTKRTQAVRLTRRAFEKRQAVLEAIAISMQIRKARSSARLPLDTLDDSEAYAS